MKGWPELPGLPESADGHVSGPSGLYRINPFEGRLLDAEALHVEQRYQDLRQRQAALIWGAGVIRGLWVEVPGLLPASLMWPATGALTGGHDPRLPLVLRRGLGVDGQGTPLALAEDLAVPIEALYQRWLAEPRALTAESVGRTRLESAPLRLTDASRMPAGAYVLVARAVEAPGADEIPGGLALGLLKVPQELPASSSAWTLRGALAADWQARERAWARASTPGFEAGDATTGEVGERPGATPLGLALLVVGADQSLVCCDPWIVRRELHAGQATRGSARGWGCGDAAAADARLRQFQQMLDESIQLRPAEKSDLNLLARGFSSLPPVGFLPAQVSAGPLDDAHLQSILDVARRLLHATNALCIIEVAVDAEAALDRLMRAGASDPVNLRAGNQRGAPGTSLDVLVPSPVGRAVRETSADRIDWDGDAISALDPWGERGLRLFGLDHIARRELELLRLIVLLRPGQERLGDRGAADPEVLPVVAFARHRVSLPLTSAPVAAVEPPPPVEPPTPEDPPAPVEPPPPVEPPHPTVRITAPAPVETLSLVEPAQLYLRVSGSAVVGSTVPLAWEIDSALELTGLTLVIGEIGASSVERWELPVGARAHAWTIPPGRYETGMGMHITVTLTDARGRVASCQSRGLMVTQPVEEPDPIPAVVSSAFLSPSRAELLYSAPGEGDLGVTAEVLRAGTTYQIQWTVTNAQRVTRQELKISDPRGSYELSPSLLVSDRHYDWSVPDWSITDPGVTLTLAVYEGSTRLYNTQLQRLRVEQAIPDALAVELLARGFLSDMIPEIYGDGSQDLVWRVSNARAAVSFQLDLMLPDGSSSLIAGGLAGATHPEGLMYSWPADAIAQLETGWNRRIRLTAVESGTGRSATAYSAPFIAVRKMDVRFVEQHDNRPWRGGYLWRLAWSPTGGRGGQEGQSPSYWSSVRLRLGATWEAGETLYQMGGQLGEVQVFLVPGLAPAGQGARSLTRTVQSDNLGLRYYARAEEEQAPLLAEPRRFTDPEGARLSDYVLRLVALLDELYEHFDGWDDYGAEVMHRAMALAVEARATVLGWCRPCDLERDLIFELQSSNFCRDQGLSPLDALSEGMALIELVDGNITLAGEMCDRWLRDVAAGLDVVSQLRGVIAALAVRGPHELAWDYNLGTSPTGARDLVESWTAQLGADLLLRHIGPDAFLRLLYAHAHPRSVAIQSPSAGQSVSVQSQLGVMGTIGAGWQRPTLTFSATVYNADGRTWTTDLGLTLQLGDLSDRQFSFGWPNGSALVFQGIQAGGQLTLQVTCTDLDGTRVTASVSVGLVG